MCEGGRIESSEVMDGLLSGVFYDLPVLSFSDIPSDMDDGMH
jgi:hypothetical protein